MVIDLKISPPDGVVMDGGFIRRIPPLLQADQDNDQDNDQNGDDNIGVLIKAKPKVKKPSMYKVVMLNDDYTPMEFVVMVLQDIFRKTEDEAMQIMLNVHKSGVGICGVYTYEIAETKVVQVMDIARKDQHPLQLRLEKE